MLVNNKADFQMLFVYILTFEEQIHVLPNIQVVLFSFQGANKSAALFGDFSNITR